MPNVKAETVVSPAGTAAYSWLLKPDTAFQQNKYKVTLLLDKTDKENQKFAKKINSAHKKFQINGSTTPSPIRDGDDGDKEDFKGNYFFTAKTKYQPKMVDTNRVELTEKNAPMSGDLIRVAMRLAPYESGNNSGVSLQLTAVQLIDKRNSGDLSIFDDISGFVADDLEVDSYEDEEDF